MEFPRITSTVNPRVKEVVRIRERRHTLERNLFVIEGSRIIVTAIEADAAIREVFFTDSFGSQREGRAIIRGIEKKGANIFAVADHVLSKITDTETPQGIAAVVSYEISSLDGIPVQENPLFAVCDGVQEPGNLGTIIRTADAAGVSAVIILEGTCDVFIPKVIRATAGSIFHVPIARAKAETFVKWLHDNSIELATTSADADTSVFDAELTGPVAFVVGSESRGVSKGIKDAADLSLNIPIYGKAESLNVAIAAAICLYEAARQRRQSRPSPHNY
jgi:TrmH family RNA methyltransferase